MGGNEKRRKRTPGGKMGGGRCVCGGRFKLSRVAVTRARRFEVIKNVSENKGSVNVEMEEVLQVLRILKERKWSKIEIREERTRVNEG